MELERLDVHRFHNIWSDAESADDGLPNAVQQISSKDTDQRKPTKGLYNQRSRVEQRPNTEANNIEYTLQSIPGSIPSADSALGILFDVNTLYELDPYETLAKHWFVRYDVDRWIRVYYRRCWKIGYASVIIYSQMLIAWLVTKESAVEYLLIPLSLYSIMHVSVALLRLNRRFFGLLLKTFEAKYLAILVTVQSLALFDILGRSYTSASLAVFLLSSQLTMASFDGLHYSFPRFDEKWSELMEIRKSIDTKYALHHPHNQHQQPPSMEQVWSTAIHEDANAVAKPIIWSCSNIHIAAEFFNRHLNSDSRWSFRDTIFWKVHCIRLFTRRDLCLIYFFALVTSMELYFVFLLYSTHHESDRHLNFLWFDWWVSEILRSALVTSVIFYLKRLFLMTIKPFYVTSIPSMQTMVPLVDSLIQMTHQCEMRNLSTIKPCSRKEIVSSTESNVTLKAKLDEQATEHNGSQSSPIAESTEEKIVSSSFPDAVKIVSKKRYPVYIFPSSGKGELFHCRDSYSIAYLGRNFSRHVMQIIYHHYFKWMIFAAVVFALWVSFLITNYQPFMWASSSMVLLFFVMNVLAQIMSLRSLYPKCLMNFEGFFMLSNLCIVAGVWQTYAPTTNYFIVVNMVSFVLWSFSVVALDARPFSSSKFQSILSKAQAEIHQNKEQYPLLNMLVQRTTSCLRLQSLCIPRDPLLTDKMHFFASSYPSSSRTLFLNQTCAGGQTNESIPRAKNQELSLLHELFSTRIKSIFLIICILDWAVLYACMETEAVEDFQRDYISILRAQWRNDSIIMTSVWNVMIFLGKRLYNLSRHPESCLSISRPRWRLPMTDQISRQIRCWQENRSFASLP